MRASEFIQENLDEDWRKWVATGAMAASALTPMAAKAQSYQAPPRDATAAMQTMRRDDPRIQQNQSQQQLANAIYAQMVKQRGQPMDARQKQTWMTIAQEKAAAQMKTQQSSPAAKSGGSNLVQPSEYHRSRMMDKDW